MSVLRIARLLAALAICLAGPAAQAGGPTRISKAVASPSRTAVTSAVDEGGANPIPEFDCDASGDKCTLDPSVIHGLAATIPFAQTLSPATTALVTQAIGAVRTLDERMKESCVSVQDFTARGGTLGLMNAIAIRAAYLEAGARGIGCVDVPGKTYVSDPITFTEYNNITFFCRGPATAGATNGSKFQPSSLTGSLFTIKDVGGVGFRNCGWNSTSQQTAGSYLDIVGSNDVICDHCSFDRGYDPVTWRDSAAGYMMYPIIRNTADKAMVFTGTTPAGTHDIFITHPQMDQDDETNPNIQAGFYADNVHGSLVIVGGDVLHQHNNFWLNPGPGQSTDWDYVIGTAFDTADFDDRLRGGAGIAITPHGDRTHTAAGSGGTAKGNRFVNVWSSTAAPGVKVVADAASTCVGNGFVDLQSLHNRTQAFMTDFCVDTTLAFPAIADASIAAPGISAAIEIGAHTNSVQIMGGFVGSESAAYPAAQKSNLQIDAGFAGLLTITGTSFQAGVVAKTCGSGGTSPCLGAPVSFDLSSGSPATGSGVVNSPGFNPLGPAIISLAVSPAVVSAGYTQATLELTCTIIGCAIPSVTVPDANGTPITVASLSTPTTSATVGTTISIPLAPAQVATVTYTGAAPYAVLLQQ